MSGMGFHSKPVNGVVTNGHAPSMVSFAIPSELQVRQEGPVASWPQPAAVRTGWWSRRVTPALRAVFAHRGWLAAIPVILVNAVAFGAQLGFWRVHLHLLLEAVLVALALESIAIYLAWQAHLAQLADDSALRLRMAAYGMALLIGALNFSHFDGPGWRPTVPAVTFGMMSVISPWLWSVHSRRSSRDALKAKGLIDPHAVRLGATRWMWHPIRSWRVMFRATWQGVNDPAAAIALPAMRAAGTAAEDVTVPAARGTEDVTPLPAAAEPRQRRQNPPASAVKTPPPSKPASKSQPGRPSSGRARAAAVIAADGALTDAEVAERAKVSESTARRARTATGAL